MQDIGLLLLRVGAGGIMFFSHGLGKILSYSEYSGSFPDPLGVSPPVSLALTAFAEGVCALFVVGGFLTRFSAAALAFTMLIAAVVIHAGDPWMKKELAVLFFTCFATLIFTGAGRYALGKGKLA